MGKYDKLNLPKIISTHDEEDDSKQERVVQVKHAILAGQVGVKEIVDSLKGIAEMATILNRGAQQQAHSITIEYAKTRHIKDSLKAILKLVNDHVEAYKQMLVDQYEVESVKSIKLTNDDVARIQYEPYLVVENKDEFRKWCIANGYANALSLPWPRANSMTKDMLLLGIPEPDGTRAYMLTKVVFTKG